MSRFKNKFKYLGQQLVQQLGSLKYRAMFKRQPRERFFMRSDVRVLDGIGNDSSKTVLNTVQRTKIKSRDTPKQGIRVIYLTTNQSICSNKSSITCEITSEITRNMFLLTKTKRP